MTLSTTNLLSRLTRDKALRSFLSILIRRTKGITAIGMLTGMIAPPASKPSKSLISESS